jgi:hypothetical protein
MKLPRWLLVSLLTVSVLAVLGGAGWWWVSWPERAVTALFDDIRANRWETARTRPGISDEALESLASLVAQTSAPTAMQESLVAPATRTFPDLLFARQRFLVPGIGYFFVIERGCLVDETINWPEMHEHLVVSHRVLASQNRPESLLYQTSPPPQMCLRCH